jgi:hypothetical protein
MRRRLLHAIVSLYPPAFRRRYGRELHDLLDELADREPRRVLRSAAGLARGAAAQWWQWSRPVALASVLVPVAALAVGVVLVTRPRPGPAVAARPATVVAGRARTVPPAKPSYPTSCFVGDVCPQAACAQLIVTRGRPQVPRPRLTCVTVHWPPSAPQMVFVVARGG